MVDHAIWDDTEEWAKQFETLSKAQTPSLFRLKHQDRTQRMEDRRKELEELNKKKSKHLLNLDEAKKKLVKARANASFDVEDLQIAIKDIENEGLKINEEEEELEKKRKKIRWNVDSLSYGGFWESFSKQPLPKRNDENPTEESEAVVEKFIKEHEEELKHLGMLEGFTHSWRFLTSHPQLVCKDSVKYLIVWCVNLQMEKKHEVMKTVVNQIAFLQHILKEAQQLNRDPKPCINIFFSRLRNPTVEFKTLFVNERQLFNEWVKKQAAKKNYEKIIKEEEESKHYIGPGGLNPYEVLNSLPQVLQRCFVIKSMSFLQESISKMDEKEVAYHMNRCIDSGLWIPGDEVQASDDEDDTRLNVDTVQIQRMEDRKNELEEHEKKKSEHAKNLNDAKNKLIEARSTSGLDVEDLEVAVADLEKEGLKICKEELELQKKGKKIPCNVDPMSHEGTSKTFINKKEPKPNVENPTDKSEAVLEKLIKDHEKELKHFGILKHYALSWEFLNSHEQLICEDAVIYLVIWCLNLEIEKKHELMETVAHQAFCLQHILELSQQLNWNPKFCAEIFFSIVNTPTAELKASFVNELQLFNERIKKLDLEKIEEVIIEAEAERKSCLGSAELNLFEVFESLPEDLKKCFEVKSMSLFQATISKMDEDQAACHMNRCIDSKLLIPRDDKADENESGASSSSMPSK